MTTLPYKCYMYKITRIKVQLDFLFVFSFYFSLFNEFFPSSSVKFLSFRNFFQLQNLFFFEILWKKLRCLQCVLGFLFFFLRLKKFGYFQRTFSKIGKYEKVCEMAQWQHYLTSDVYTTLGRAGVRFFLSEFFSSRIFYNLVKFTSNVTKFTLIIK